MARLEFKLPDIGEGVVEGEIVAWHVAQGEQIAEDQPLVDMMTDKATVTIPSDVDATVMELRGDVGDLIPVGATLVVFDTDGTGAVDQADQADGSDSSTATDESNGGGKPESSPPANKPAEPAREFDPTGRGQLPSGARGSDGGVTPLPASLAGRPATPTAGNPAGGIPKPAPQTPRPPGTSSRPLASPAVRKKAQELNIDLTQVPGTGPAGRVTHADLESFLKAGPSLAAAGFAPPVQGVARTGLTEVPVIGLRRKIAEKMEISKRTIPHFSYWEEVDVTALEELRQHLNAVRDPSQPRLTYIPFIMLALVKAMRLYPHCNGYYDDQRKVMIQYEALHLGIATKTDKGLIVPVVKHTEALDLWGCASEMMRVTQAARDGSATREELMGSTFTITSLGRLGGLGATPVINHPEVGIMGIHRAEDRAVAYQGQLAIRKRMNVSASFDHRIVDGADGAELIQQVKAMLEHPATIFMPE